MKKKITKMSDMTGDKSAKLPTFDGKVDNFQLWWRRFKAYAGVNKFVEALNEKGDPDMPKDDTTALDPTDDDDKKKIVAKKRNTLAVAAFTMAFETESLMAFIDKGCNMAWPEGHANLIVKSLIKKYKPTDIMSKVEMRIEINKVSMKANEDPSTLFTQLSSIEVRYKTAIANEEKMATILSVCPKEYKSVITSEQRYRGSGLTMDHLEEAMGDHFRSLQFGDNAIKIDDELTM